MTLDLTKLRAAFPDYDVASLPPIPLDFADVSWRNEQCPCFMSERMGLRVFIDYADATEREFPESARFSLHLLAWSGTEWVVRDEPDLLAVGDDWRFIMAAIEGRALEVAIGDAFADLLRADLTVRQWGAMCALNATDAYADVCASHDFCDANMPMLEAFTAIMGRSLIMGEDGPAQEADHMQWGRAWDYAKVRHLGGWAQP